jgi:hypothetical protein
VERLPQEDGKALTSWAAGSGSLRFPLPFFAPTATPPAPFDAAAPFDALLFPVAAPLEGLGRFLAWEARLPPLLPCPLLRRKLTAASSFVPPVAATCQDAALAQPITRSFPLASFDQRKRSGGRIAFSQTKERNARWGAGRRGEGGWVRREDTAQAASSTEKPIDRRDSFTDDCIEDTFTACRSVILLQSPSLQDARDERPTGVIARVGLCSLSHVQPRAHC